MTLRSFWLAFGISLYATVSIANPRSKGLIEDNLGDKILIGYWHNFDNGSGSIKLRDVSPAFDLIEVAFAEPVGDSLGFTPFNASVDEFKKDIATLQAKGKKVLISIGGANSIVHLDNAELKSKFIKSMINIVQTYGFDGIDLDLEGASLSLNAGDTNFKKPTTPAITNMIAAVRQIHDHFGERFLLTMAPETYYVQIGAFSYGGPAGAYLPVIYALRDILDILQVQHYNSGSIMGLDDANYVASTPDFHVALVDMLLNGFAVARDPNMLFPALRADQIAIGLPAAPSAAGSGFTSVENVQKAFRYLVSGKSFNGQYELLKGKHYPDLRGLMTWSINWDAANNFEFSRQHRKFLDSL